ADTGPLNLSHYQQKTANEVRSLDIKPQLVRIPKYSLWTSLKEKIFLWMMPNKLNNPNSSKMHIVNDESNLNNSNDSTTQNKNNKNNPENINNSTMQNINNEKIYMIPLPDFTVYPKNHNNQSQGFITTLSTIIRIMIFPRSRIITEKKHYSPFLHVIDNEYNTKVYNCPSIIAATDFKWATARKHFLRHFVTYLIFVISFALSTLNYTSNKVANSKTFELHRNIISWTAYVISLYFGYYFFISELIQFKRERLSRYANIFNFFDLISVILPISIIISKLSVYNNSNQNYTLQIITAFTMLIMYFQLLLLLRYFRAPGHYIYIINNILNEIWPFLTFMLIVIFGFGHAMYILLSNPAEDPVKSLYSFDTYSIRNSSNSSQNLYPDIKILHDVDLTSGSSNYFANFFTSVEAVFFWTNGRWDQLSNWNSVAVNVMNILGSLILVLIFQNLLISFMNGSFTEADVTGRNAARRYRAEMICEYETLEKPFDSKRGNPRYIYYTANSDIIDKWLDENKAHQQKCRMNGNHLLLDEEDYKSKSKDILKLNDYNGKNLKGKPFMNSIESSDTLSSPRSDSQLPDQNFTSNLDMSEQLEIISKRLEILDNKDKNKNGEFEN
ncbi:4459_t:CDS:2, partial [Gigaspora rosea]